MKKLIIIKDSHIEWFKKNKKDDSFSKYIRRLIEEDMKNE